MRDKVSREVEIAAGVAVKEKAALENEVNKKGAHISQLESRIQELQVNFRHVLIVRIFAGGWRAPDRGGCRRREEETFQRFSRQEIVLSPRPGKLSPCPCLPFFCIVTNLKKSRRRKEKYFSLSYLRKSGFPANSGASVYCNIYLLTVTR